MIDIYKAMLHADAAAPIPRTVAAFSANVETDDWPSWYVAASRHSMNQTGRIARALGYDFEFGAVLTSRGNAERLAEQWNARTP